MMYKNEMRRIVAWTAAKLLECKHSKLLAHEINILRLTIVCTVRVKNYTKQLMQLNEVCHVLPVAIQPYKY